MTSLLWQSPSLNTCMLHLVWNYGRSLLTFAILKTHLKDFPLRRNFLFILFIFWLKEQKVHLNTNIIFSSMRCYICKFVYLNCCTYTIWQNYGRSLLIYAISKTYLKDLPVRRNLILIISFSTFQMLVHRYIIFKMKILCRKKTLKTSFTHWSYIRR